MKRKYTCAQCGVRFESVATEKEQEAECVALFGANALEEELDIVCDRCYNMAMLLMALYPLPSINSKSKKK